MRSLLICFSLCLLWSVPMRASHIVGGEMSYRFIEHDASATFAVLEVTLTLYRDPEGIPYDLFADFGIFVQEPWGAWKSYDVVVDAPISPVQEIQDDSDPCKTRQLSQARLEVATYKFRTRLELNNGDYLITYQKCCRNHTIANLEGAGSVGSVYDVFITEEALESGSSSPSFDETPPIFICAGFVQNLDQSVTDVDGDQVSYSYCTPLFPGPDDGGTTCCGCVADPDPFTCLPPFLGLTYIPPFNDQNPMGGNPIITINNSTGFMTGIPDLTGSYVVGVCVEERRNGILYSKTRRDYEFNVVDLSLIHI